MKVSIRFDWRTCAEIVIATALVMLAVTVTAQTTVVDATVYSGNWRSHYDACFDSRGNTDFKQLRLFVRNVEAAKSRLSANDSDAEAPLLDDYLLTSYTLLARYNDAMALVVPPPPGQRATGRLALAVATPEGAIRRARIGAALFASMGDLRGAFTWYLDYVYLDVRYAAMPATLLGLILLSVWRYGKSGSKLRMSQPALALALLTCIPMLSALYTAVTEPLISYVVSGNCAAFVTNRRVDYIVISIGAIAYAAVIGTSAFVIGRRLRRTADARVGTAHGIDASRVKAAYTIRTLMSLLALACAGTMLDYGSATIPTHMFSKLHGGAITDPWWMLTTAGAVFIVPFCEEYCFRATIYKSARGLMGPLYGAAFTSILFAGVHLDMQRFAQLLWAGLVYAMLYEIGRSMRLPFAAHMLHNLLV